MIFILLLKHINDLVSISRFSLASFLTNSAISGQDIFDFWAALIFNTLHA